MAWRITFGPDPRIGTILSGIEAQSQLLQSILSLLRQVMGTQVSAAQALSDLQAAVSANAAAITQLGTDLAAFIAKIPAGTPGVDPTAVENIATSIDTAVAAAQALDATINAPSGVVTPQAAALKKAAGV